MKRALTLLLVAAALLGIGAQPATATDLSIDQQAEIAVTDHFIYWVKIEPGHCRGCTELWRVPVSGGAHERMSRVKNGDISFLEGGGSVLAYTSFHYGPIQRTRVHTISDDGPRGILASAAYRVRARQNCGSMISSGSVSADGEVAWQRVDVPNGGGSCSKIDAHVIWSAYAGSLGAGWRELLAPRKLRPTFLSLGRPIDALVESSPIASFEGARLLTAPFQALPRLYPTPNGKPVQYKSPAKVDSVARLDLSPSGAVLGSYYASAYTPDPVYSNLLFPRPFDPSYSINLNVAGLDTFDLHFCGERVLQLAVARKAFRLIVRTMDGTIVSSTDFPFKGGEPEGDFLCNGGSAVLQLGTWSGSGAEDMSRTVSVPLK